MPGRHLVENRRDVYIALALDRALARVIRCRFL
jgi:hypothetical protein